MPGDTYQAPQHGWTCFHCGETFTTVGSAADHFGYTQFADPGCIIDRVALEEGGKPERGRGLLTALRKAEAELARYREEDTELHRALHAKDGEHATALQREEEKGYARGLRDAWKYPKDAGYVLIPALRSTPLKLPPELTHDPVPDDSIPLAQERTRGAASYPPILYAHDPTAAQFSVCIDETLPPGTLEVRDAGGKVLARIVGMAEGGPC